MDLKERKVLLKIGTHDCGMLMVMKIARLHSVKIIVMGYESGHICVFVEEKEVKRIKVHVEAGTYLKVSSII
jgi:hypothetical protein